MLRTSVIIPTYNRVDYLSLALQSVFDQSLQPFEVIVVDDGSTDGTQEMVAGLGDRVRYFRHDQNKGVSAARNLGLDVARGDVIAWLDADDLWEPDFLATTISHLEREPGIDGIYTGCVHIDAQGNLLFQAGQTVVPPLELYTSLIKGNFIATPAIVVYRRCFQDVGHFDLQLGICEDYDMWLKLAKSYAVAGLATPLVKIRIHDSNTVGDVAAFSRFRLALVQKHFGESDGDPATWPESKRHAFAYAYREVAFRAPDGRWQYLARSASIWPGILEQLDTFYELACGDQPRGERGHAATLDIERNETDMFSGLDTLFAQADSGLAIKRRVAYGNAYLALAMLSEQAGDWKLARHYMFLAVKAYPRLLTDRSVVRRWFKLLAGHNLASIGRRLAGIGRGLAVETGD